MKAIINANTYDFDHYRENQYILFDEKIVATGSMEEFLDKDYEIIDGRDHLIMPSLVN